MKKKEKEALEESPVIDTPGETASVTPDQLLLGIQLFAAKHRETRTNTGESVGRMIETAIERIKEGYAP